MTAIMIVMMTIMMTVMMRTLLKVHDMQKTEIMKSHNLSRHPIEDLCSRQ